MATYRVWVSNDEGSVRVYLSDKDDEGQTEALVVALLKMAGGAGFDLGVTVTAPAVPAPPPPAPPPPPATQSSEDSPRTQPAGKRGQTHWPAGGEPQ